MDKRKTGKTRDSKLCKQYPTSVCSTQISLCNHRDIPSKGERPLSVESQEDGLPTLVGGVITVWEETHTKNNTRCTCTYSQCMPRVHLMTFELTGDTCALLLVGVASAFVTVSHVQQ